MFGFISFAAGKSVPSVQRRIDKLHEDRKNIRETIQLAVADRTAAIKSLQEDVDEFYAMDRTF